MHQAQPGTDISTRGATLFRKFCVFPSMPVTEAAGPAYLYLQLSGTAPGCFFNASLRGRLSVRAFPPCRIPRAFTFPGHRFI